MKPRRSQIKRCPWAESHELLKDYHDMEWGVPVHSDRLLFEMLNLEGAQAGLSWLTVLKKRDQYRKAFSGFDAKKIAKFSEAKKAVLLQNEGLIRNRLKIQAVVENARAFLAIQKEGGSFDEFIWQFVDGKPLTSRQRRKALKVSQAMSQALKKKGFRFVGPTICFAFMQAVGMINDHSTNCFRRRSFL